MPAQISFLAGNLREAVLGRNEDHLRRSRQATQAIGAAEADSLAADAFTRERWEVLKAVTESFEVVHGAEHTLDHVALSQFASQLSLLESLQSHPPVPSIR